MTTSDYTAGYNAYMNGEGVESTLGRTAAFDRGYWAAHDECADYYSELECLDRHDGECAGDVDYRIAMSGTGVSYPRCDHHFAIRWATQERISRTYGVPLVYDGSDY